MSNKVKMLIDADAGQRASELADEFRQRLIFNAGNEAFNRDSDTICSDDVEVANKLLLHDATRKGHWRIHYKSDRAVHHEDISQEDSVHLPSASSVEVWFRAWTEYHAKNCFTITKIEWIDAE